MINFLDLKKINKQYRSELIDACTRVIDSGWYICGNELKNFEQNFALFCGTKYAIGVANGLDALILVLRAWKELGKLKDGDEVFVVLYNNRVLSLQNVMDSIKDNNYDLSNISLLKQKVLA